jgi:hypothetical protein
MLELFESISLKTKDKQADAGFAFKNFHEVLMQLPMLRMIQIQNNRQGTNPPEAK